MRSCFGKPLRLDVMRMPFIIISVVTFAHRHSSPRPQNRNEALFLTRHEPGTRCMSWSWQQPRLTTGERVASLSFHRVGAPAKRDTFRDLKHAILYRRIFSIPLERQRGNSTITKTKNDGCSDGRCVTKGMMFIVLQHGVRVTMVEKESCGKGAK